MAKVNYRPNDYRCLYIHDEKINAGFRLDLRELDIKSLMTIIYASIKEMKNRGIKVEVE